MPYIKKSDPPYGSRHSWRFYREMNNRAIYKVKDVKLQKIMDLYD